MPAEVRDPNAGFTCGHFQLDGPHRLVSTAGRRRWLLPPEYMYPIERATRSGLVGPWRTPDIGELPAGLNPGGIEPWGISNFQIFPNIEILIYGGLVSAVPILAHLAQHPPVRGLHVLSPGAHRAGTHRT